MESQGLLDAEEIVTPAAPKGVSGEKLPSRRERIVYATTDLEIGALMRGCPAQLATEEVRELFWLDELAVSVCARGDHSDDRQIGFG